MAYDVYPPVKSTIVRYNENVTSLIVKAGDIETLDKAGLDKYSIILIIDVIFV